MTSGSRARYLLFALAVRKLTDALIAFVEEGQISPGLKPQITEVLASIEGTGKSTSVQALRQRGSFGSYEGTVTMADLTSFEKKDLIRKLNAVLTAKSEKEKKNGALQAIKVFDTIESKALHRYNHAAPRGRFVAV